MRIITYNLRAGGAGKAHWGKVFDSFDPDVFMAQESYEPIHHLPPLIYGEQHRDACWTRVEGVKWGSAVWVRNAAARLIELPDFHGNVVGVEVDATVFSVSDGRPIRVFSVHAPKRGSYQRAVNSILDMIGANRGDGDLIIGGDFNLSVGERLESEELKTSRADLVILARLKSEFGLMSSWQAANRGVPLPQTLRWAKEKVTPFHCDGIFIPQRWSSRLKTCTVVSGPDWNELSDHNPVMVELI